jgi:UDP-GlcNAc:undecaprenyl-phosphate GlcNAc-1-phosphate transferase
VEVHLIGFKGDLYGEEIEVVFLENRYISLLFTCFWIVGMTNAINLVDSLNGLSSGITAISGFFFGLLAWERGDMAVAVMSMGLCGSSLGFLRHNFPKAHIFMGDAGTMFLGFSLATLAVMGTWASTTEISSMAMPVLILGYPIFDTTLVVISRIRDKRPIFQGGKDHSSHRLSILGLRKRRAVLVIFFISFCLGFLGYILSKVRQPMTAILIVAIAFLSMAALGVRLNMVAMESTGRRKG